MLVLFYLLLPFVTKGCTLVGKGETETVTGYAGDSVVLPCTCTDHQSKPVEVTWKKYTTTWTKIPLESEQYKDRFQLVTDVSPGNLSLLISHLTEEDRGDYSCSPKNGELRYVRLIVEGCKINQQFETVTGTVGQSVLLPCSCSEPKAKPQKFIWNFNIDIDNNNNNTVQIFPKDQSNRYTERVQIYNHCSPGNLSLLISRLSLQDKGWYRCKISNDQLKDVQLLVNEAPIRPSSSTPNIIETNSEAGLEGNEETSGTSERDNPPIVIISSSVVGVLLLLLILGALVYWKNRGRRQTEFGDGQTGQRTQQQHQEQDFSKPQNLTMTSETTESVKKQNNSKDVYAAINPKTERNKPEEKDDVMYSTVVHSKTVRASQTPVTTEDTAVYASVKTN